jgi:hypothetical protein
MTRLPTWIMRKQSGIAADIRHIQTRAPDVSPALGSKQGPQTLPDRQIFLKARDPAPVRIIPGRG